MDYSSFKTEFSKRRTIAWTRKMVELTYCAPKGTISMAEGKPNEETFPFTEISVKLNDGSSFILEKEELGNALQYIPSQGYPPLLKILKEYQKRAHDPPLWESRDIIITTGAQDGISKILEAVINIGDPILIPEFFYPGVKIVLDPYQPEIITIPQNEDGPILEVLRKELKSRQRSGKKMPKIMYINSTGTNPTGIIIPLERRKEIYNIACEYNFLILDDDPYHFMNFDEEEPKSFLSLDTEGRVVRIDSFSKTISSGMRIGFMIAATSLIKSVELHIQSNNLHTSTLSQMILYKILKIWGYDGLMANYSKLKHFYKKRRDNIVVLARKHLSDLADFETPKSSIFLWVKVRGIENTWKMIMQDGFANGVIMEPGAMFTKNYSEPSNGIRICYSKVSYQEMDMALQRLAKLIRMELAKSNATENVDTS